MTKQVKATDISTLRDIDVSEFFEHYNRDISPEEIEEMERSNQEWDDEERKNYLLYDPGSRQKILYPDCIEKYGRAITDKMFSADNKNSGTVDTKTWQQIQDIHKGKRKKQITEEKKTSTIIIAPESEIIVQAGVVEPAPITQKQREIGDDYFQQLERGVIRNEQFRRIFREKGRSILYDYLWANIVRDGWIDKPGYPIKESYYNKGYLAYCSSLRELGLACGLDKNTVKSSLDEFKELGIIKIEQIIPQGKAYGQTVAILGEWRAIEQGGSVKISERYYRDEVFLAPPADVPFQFKK